ncbi:MAG: hypothetical protein H6500_00370 [Candidatus Woesearchaeota archaeon]|nr:MAG: hypothetical protein H6500_00370 [Candidatus Woesearchaeota archaeon]
MLPYLKSLIFGFDENEKTKIEYRYAKAISILNKVYIDDPQDFQVLEDTIAKIREQLRIKSSHLCKIINNPARPLKKREVLALLEGLEKIKNTYITKQHNNRAEQAQTSIEIQQETDFIPTPTIMPEKVPEQNSQQDLEKERKEQTKSEEKKEERETEEKLETKNEKTLLYETPQYKAKLINGKVPMIEIQFQDLPNYAILKTFSSIFFEQYQPHGTTILTQKNRSLIIPRTQGDNLITLPKIQSNLEENIQKIITRQTGTQNQEQKKEEPQEYKEIEIEDTSRQNIHTKKFEEDSLDSLLETMEHKEEEEEKKKASEKQKEKEVKKEEKQTTQQEETIQIEHDKDEVPIFLEEKKKQEEKKTDQDTVQFYDRTPAKFEIYSDDQIIVTLAKNTKQKGVLKIRNTQNKAMEKLNESEISYMMIFSKIFSSILFEITNAQGTNLIWNHKEGSLSVVPRYENDTLNNLTWKGNKDGEEFQEQILQKLLTSMHSAMQEEQNQTKTKEKKVEEKKEQIPEKKEENREQKSKTKENKDPKKKEKAEYLITSLRRIA